MKTTPEIPDASQVPHCSGCQCKDPKVQATHAMGTVEHPNVEVVADPDLHVDAAWVRQSGLTLEMEGQSEC